MGMPPFRSAKGFLKYGGIVLLLVGILGFVGVIGPTPDRGLFGSAWNFSPVENWAHTILGIVALIAVHALKQEGQQKNLVYLVGVVALLVGIIGFFSTLGGILENPLDNILHIIVAIWAFWAAMGGKQSGGAPAA